MKNGFTVGCLWIIGTQLASGQSIDYSAERGAALRDCDEYYYRGDRFEADGCYAELLTQSDDAAVRAEAAWRRGDLTAANAYFRTAVEITPDSAPIRNRWGRLFLATHQNNDAVKLFQEALELEEDFAPAKMGLAAVSAGRFEDRARALVQEVLGADESDIEAQLLIARLSLEDGALGRADEALSAALRIAGAQDLPPLEVYALNASADLLKGITDSEWTDRALAYNPGFGEIYATPAHFYVITRRYREAIELLFEAVRVQSDLWSAHAELGVNLLRENRVDEAQAHLALAYQGDPYSAQIVNTLRLIDSFENFRVLNRELPDNGSDSDEPTLVTADTEPVTVESPGIVLRLHEEEAGVLDVYVTDLVVDSVRTFSERYQFDLREPVIVELYPEHDDFAVRTSGLPGIGLLGVTFGYLVAMDSPSGRGEGEFHWGTTLWHEMAHVFTLEATDHLVPRWFSEGVSVFEEWTTGPRPGRHIPMHVLDAMQEEKLLPIADLDSGFIRPSYQGQVMVSYMQAGLVCQHIERTWGQQGLVDLLELYREGRDTVEAIEQGLGVSPETFDVGFKEFLEAEFRATLDGLESWREHNEAASEAMNEADWEAVVEATSAANELYAGYVDEGNVYPLKAKAHDELEQRDAAIETLETYWRLGGFAPGLLHQLADWLEEAGRTSDAAAVLTDVLMAAPLDESLHATLGDWLLEDGLARPALREYQALLAMNPHDQAAAHYRLATAYLALEDEAKTREHVLYALETAPHYREAQQLLLEILR